ncbi:hypothetical protein DET50_1051 [Marinobacter pelagius]|uniref:Uncharacterized protein n=1 Tax=Marinobacter pelagius TaxID=379482 RepID=A0A366GVC8_9GAMM|nr:hypothetical protein [Marinobacter pelagius]RBP31777.1 hypothetical protein DET50_1051 [Marinobacter pelagius]
MNKLPVLFVSCNAGSLQSQQDAGSGPARMIWGKRYQSVVLISTDTDLQAPLIVHLKGSADRSESIHRLLGSQGFAPDSRSYSPNSRDGLLRVLLSEEPGDLSELRLNTGMSEQEYRRIGQCLEVLREQGVLIICLDDKADSQVLLHDRHLREMINGWVQDQQWGTVMKFKGDAPKIAPTLRLDDPTVCLLNAAFSLGGSQFPQRMFSSGMDNSTRMLSGFGWMR